jgi:hypothetical protein
VTLRGKVRELIEAVYPLEGELLLVLDTNKALDLSWEAAGS